MAAPAEGFKAGELLAPNYLQRLIARGGEEAPYYERITLDAGDVEGSFRARTGYDIRQALREVAPGFDPGAGPITIETLETRVRPDQTRSPAKDEGLAPLALLAPAVFGIAAWAAAGGAAAGAGTAAEAAAAGNHLMPPAILAPETAGFVPLGPATGGGVTFVPPEMVGGGLSGLTAQEVATMAQSGLKIAAAAAPAIAAASLGGQMAQRQQGAPIAGRSVDGADLGGWIVTESQQQKAPQANSGAVPPNYISGGGAGMAILAIVAVILFALTKG